MKSLQFTWLFTVIACITYAQKTIEPIRISDQLSIDGNLDETAWNIEPIKSEFTTIEPAFNKTATYHPEIKMLYDDHSVYVGAFIPAANREEIKTQLVARDNIGNSDFFMVILDTYGNGTQGFEFVTTSAGIQFDANVDGNGEDQSWDAVWESSVQIVDNGWYVEMEIPYSAFRFPKQEVQPWRVNFLHRCVATGEKSTFQAIDPNVPGFINQTSIVNGVKNIKSPLRLSLTPYFTSYYTAYKDRNGDFTDGFNHSGGMDLKYGINDAFTLDMTLIPDFGQVRADDNQLNLSPFEIQFSENRPFFTEGLELFNRGNLFYTRRVGGRPIGFYNAYNQLKDNEKLQDNPINTRLLNASKISGRTKSGWGIGVFNAIARKSFAVAKNNFDEERSVETSPLTNYNVTVIDKSLPNNSYVSLINTNVTRFNSEYHNANVTGADYNLRLINDNLGVSGKASVSRLLHKDETQVTGYKFSTRIAKISGKFNYSIYVGGTSKNYDNNDLGYNARTNVMEYSPQLNYSFNEGLWKFAMLNTWMGYTHFTRYEDQKTLGRNINAGLWGRTPNQWTFNMWTNLNPDGYDQFEARKDGQLMEQIGDWNMGWYIGSDSRKKLSSGFYISTLKGFKQGYYNYQFGIEPRWRISDKLSIYGDFNYNIYRGSRNFVTMVEGEPVIGIRDRNTIINTVRFTYTLNKNMSLSSRVRHYWTKVNHTDYYGLSPEGELIYTDFNDVYAYTYNGLNVNTEFKWRFAPGSDIVAVWQNNISGSDRYSPGQDQVRYINGIKSLKNLAQDNSISLRILYYLDAGKYL